MRALNEKVGIFENQLIGKGSTGNVYRGQMLDSGAARLAIKAIQLAEINNEVTQYLLSCQIVALSQLGKLKHENVVQLKDIIFSEKYCYLAMQILQGGSLTDFIKSRPNGVEQQQALKYFRQMFQGYKVIQQMKIVHRDIKPDNIMFHRNESQNQLAFIDFGYCTVESVANKPKAYYNVGSPKYMSPQAFKENIYSQKSDIWALGIILFELLHGKTIDSGMEMEQYMNFLRKNPIPIRKQLSPTTRQLLLGMLNFDYRRRLSCKQIEQMLEAKAEPQNNGLNQQLINPYNFNKGLPQAMSHQGNMNQLFEKKVQQHNHFFKNQRSYPVFNSQVIPSMQQNHKQLKSIQRQAPLQQRNLFEQIPHKIFHSEFKEPNHSINHQQFMQPFNPMERPTSRFQSQPMIEPFHLQNRQLLQNNMKYPFQQSNHHFSPTNSSLKRKFDGRAEPMTTTHSQSKNHIVFKSTMFGQSERMQSQMGPSTFDSRRMDFHQRSVNGSNLQHMTAIQSPSNMKQASSDPLLRLSTPATQVKNNYMHKSHSSNNVGYLESNKKLLSPESPILREATIMENVQLNGGNMSQQANRDKRLNNQFLRNTLPNTLVSLPLNNRHGLSNQQSVSTLLNENSFQPKIQNCQSSFPSQSRQNRVFTVAQVGPTQISRETLPTKNRISSFRKNVESNFQIENFPPLNMRKMHFAERINHNYQPMLSDRTDQGAQNQRAIEPQRDVAHPAPPAPPGSKILAPHQNMNYSKFNIGQPMQIRPFPNTMEQQNVQRFHQVRRSYDANNQQPMHFSNSANNFGVSQHLSSQRRFDQRMQASSGLRTDNGFQYRQFVSRPQQNMMLMSSDHIHQNIRNF